jgi:hypothetical protein
MARLSLAEFVHEAAARNLCWRIGCTTCGNQELRHAIRQLSRDSPSPFAQEHAAFGPAGATAFLEPLTQEEADRLATICAEADLEEARGVAPSSDWLGYLGMILNELAPFRRQRLRIGKSWALQFVGMGGDRETWAEFETRPMSWRDLEAAERERSSRSV